MSLMLVSELGEEINDILYLVFRVILLVRYYEWFGA